MPRSSHLAAAAAALALAAVPATPSAASPTDRAGDSGGPLDLLAASLSQQGPDLHLTLRTRGSWGPRQLVPSQQRSLCVVLFRGTTNAARSRLCVAGRSDSTRAALRFERLSPGGAVLAQRTLTDVHRPNVRTLEATFTPAQVELPLGAYRWLVTSSWTGPPDCAAKPCTDRLPDGGTIHGTILPPRVAGCVPTGASFRSTGPGSRKVVALTFDDGPSIYTSQVLRILRRFKIHATFFLIGEQIGANAGLVRQELAEGNAIGDHTWNHSNVAGGGSFAYSQLSRTRAAIRRASRYYTPCLFRAPGGSVSGALFPVARSLGMLTIQWDVDPRDWSRPGSDSIYSTVVGQARRESIILMHDGGGPRSQTVAALPGIIRTLRSRGYGFETVPDLLRLKPVYG
ncbi:MAG TPA: polysaccharide deacetylase family protein [Solirubrobacteraceae bacterium]|nr:polysaccharide deacetylase family protein [Solirubrobacteraceae bacterium]